MKKIQVVCIIGLGLMGGSLALAIRKKRLAKKIIGVAHKPITVREALKVKAIDEGGIQPEKSTSSADLVFICTPIRTIIPILKKIAKHLKPGCIVTDVGSVKAEIVREAEKILPKNVYFVGGHPMVGSEKSGFEASIPDLYENATYIITPTKSTNKAALKTLKDFLKRLNVNIVEISRKKQDDLVAGISHLPLAVAVSLVNTIAKLRNRDEYLSLASSGFRDTTRIASGSVRLSEDLLLFNRKALIPMIEKFKDVLNDFEKKIKKGKIRKELIFAKNFRDKKFK